MPDRFDNPYMGPRTFTQQESNRFFGRNREADNLLALVISNRLVLFYAQSGAGKSSLLNTRLVPHLRQERFLTLPVSRVSGGELPQDIGPIKNIYAFNLMLSLDQGKTDPSLYAGRDLTQFLSKLTTKDGRHYYYNPDLPDTSPAPSEYNVPPHVLVIDQFEEIVTTHLDRWQDREEFFHQLAQAMIDDPLL